MFPQSLNISLSDPHILDFIKSGKTETKWNFCQNYKVEEVYKEIDDFCFYDIANLNAICRPGAYDFFIADYLLNRKLHFENKPIPHAIPEFPDITENTYGLIIYRQQVEESIIRLTNCSEEFARKARKAYGARSKTKMAENAEFINNEGLKNGFNISTINKVLDALDKNTCYVFNSDYAYYSSLKIYMDALYQLHFPAFVEYEKEDQTEFLRDLVDVTDDYYTFRKNVIEHFGEFYALQTDIFFDRAVKLAEKDLPLSAIQDALFALSLQVYQDKKGISMLLGFLGQVYFDIDEFWKAMEFSELGRKFLDPNDPDFAEDSKMFDRLDDLIKGQWAEDVDLDLDDD